MAIETMQYTIADKHSNGAIVWRIGVPRPKRAPRARSAADRKKIRNRRWKYDGTGHNDCQVDECDNGWCPCAHINLRALTQGPERLRAFARETEFHWFAAEVYPAGLKKRATP